MHTFVFRLATESACRQLWRSAVDRHVFFRVDNDPAASPPRRTWSSGVLRPSPLHMQTVTVHSLLRVPRTAMNTNAWGLNKAAVKRELLDTVKARKLAYYGHTTRKQGSCLEKEIMQRTMPGARRRGRPRWTTSRHGQDSPWNSQSV